MWGQPPSAVRAREARQRGPTLFAGFRFISRFSCFSFPSPPSADCIPSHEAPQHNWRNQLHDRKSPARESGRRWRALPRLLRSCAGVSLDGVIFSHALIDIGEVRRRARRTIEIRGEIKLYDDRPEIILSRIRQIEGVATMIPPMPGPD